MGMGVERGKGNEMMLDGANHENVMLIALVMMRCVVVVD